jgi:hypothetical protein
MPDPIPKPDAHHASPPLAPKLHDALRDAEALLDLMGREALATVAELAETLSARAHDAGAFEIEAAANRLRHLASGHGPVALAGAMHALSAAITRTERS